MDLFEKLYISRKLLTIKQKDAAEQSGVRQAIISIIERGERDAVPNEYFKFLYKKGIDLNWFFNEEEDDIAKAFRIDKSSKLNVVDSNGLKNLSYSQNHWTEENLTLRKVVNLDKVLNELLSEIKHLNVKVED